jgi:hypothetical protein
MTDKPYEASALDLSILRAALKAHEWTLRTEFRNNYMGSVRSSEGGKQCAEQLQATEDLIERIDNCDNLYIEVNV